MGRTSKYYKKLIKQIKVSMIMHRTELKKKNAAKVRCLKNKIKRETFKLPQHLDRYKDVEIFRSDDILTPEELKGPVIVGRREITLSVGEKRILTRGP